MERAFGMVVEAGVVALVFSSFVEQGLLPHSLFVLYNVASIVGLVFLIDKSRYWSFGYLFGWVAGIFMSLGTLVQTDLLGLLDLLIYSGTTVAAVYLRVKIHS